MIKRYVVYADGDELGHTETAQKAYRMANEYLEHCTNQDVPYRPKIDIIIEALEEEKDD